MARSTPARYFRATAAFGVLAAGLLAPTAASAQNVTPTAPTYALAFEQAGSVLTPGVQTLVRGTFDTRGAETVAAVHPSPGDGQPASVELLGVDAKGLTTSGAPTPLHMTSVVGAAAGRVLGPNRQSLVAVGTSSDVPMLQLLDWHDGTASRVWRSIPATPVSVAVGRFLPNHGEVVAVSMVGDRYAIYDVDDGEPRTLASGDMTTGPMVTVSDPASAYDDLLVPGNGGTAYRSRWKLATDGSYERDSAPVTVPVSPVPGDTVAAQDRDPGGGAWFITRGYSSDGVRSMVFGASGRSYPETQPLGPVLLREARGDAPLVGDFLGRGGRDVAAILDGERLRAVDTRTPGDELSAPLPSGTTGVPVDADADGRDDVVVVNGPNVELFHNATGDVETTPHTDGKTIVPSVADPRAPRRIVTKRTFRLTRPAGDTAMWDCVLVDADGGRQGCMLNAAITVPADGDYRLEVRRQEEGHSFWSPIETIALRVDSTVPGTPQILSTPDALTSYPQFMVASVAGVAVEYQLDDEQDWHRLDGPYLHVDAPDGPHHVRFRAIDPVREVASETTKDYAFTVDRTRPKAPTKIAGPADVTSDRDATFAFEGEPDSRFECLVDRVEPDGLGGVAARGGLVWDDCASPFVVRDLALGTHTVTVRQVDAAGNRGAQTTWTWEIVEKAAEPVAPTPAPAAPAKEDKPAPVATTPAPAPTRAADEPVKAKLSVGAPAGKGKTPVATATGRRVAVGCAAPGAEGYRCAVTVTRGGKTVGQGRRTGAGLVPVDLDKATAKKVQRLGGLKVRVTLAVKTAGGDVTTTSKTVRILPRKVLVVPTDGLFAFASATPSREADALAKDVAGQLDGARTITIVGHTDAVGSADVNRRLGQRRAEAFRRLLAKHGFDGEVKVASEGDTQPRASNATKAGRALNRRVEIDVRY